MTGEQRDAMEAEHHVRGCIAALADGDPERALMEAHMAAVLIRRVEDALLRDGARWI